MQPQNQSSFVGPGRGDTTEADFNLARANLSATLASHEKAGVTVFRPANTTVRMDDGTDVIVPAGPRTAAEECDSRRHVSDGVVKRDDKR